MIRKILKWGFGIIFILLVGASIWLYQFAANWNEIDEPIYSKTLTSIQVPLGKFVLVRGKTGLGAFRLNHRISRYGFLNGVKYEYWINEHGKFNSINTKTGSGTVYEKYKHVKVISNSEQQIEDAGGKYNISIGNYLIEWSRGNYVYNQSYFSSGPFAARSEPFEIAATNWIDINDIDFTDKSLKWLKSINEAAQVVK